MSKIKPTRVTRILRAQARVSLAEARLLETRSDDDRFEPALLEYRAALEARRQEEGKR